MILRAVLDTNVLVSGFGWSGPSARIIDAVVAAADYIVTGDAGLLALGDFEGIRIVAPAEFVSLLGTEL